MNDTKLMKSQSEILERIKKVEKDDFFGVERGNLIAYLEFENAKEFLEDGVTKEKWNKNKSDPVEDLKKYMPFAWEKANDHRGLSSGRSLSHMRGWLWLDGQDDLVDFLNDESNYAPYGKPVLSKICAHYSLPDEHDGNMDCHG